LCHFLPSLHGGDCGLVCDVRIGFSGFARRSVGDGPANAWGAHIRPLCGGVGIDPRRERREPSGVATPFDRYEGGGRRLLGKPAWGNGSSRRGYGLVVFDQCGSVCVYCGYDMGAAYESWLNLSIDHVIPAGDVSATHPRR